MLQSEGGVLEREGAEPESQTLHGQSRSHSVEEDQEEDSKWGVCFFSSSLTEIMSAGRQTGYSCGHVIMV